MEIFAASQRSVMVLSHEKTVELRISIKSICACVRFMLAEGASFELTHAFNQDPLEQHFGHNRVVEEEIITPQYMKYKIQ